jgi:hypothetical protein
MSSKKQQEKVVSFGNISNQVTPSGKSPNAGSNAKYAFKSAFVSKYRTKISRLKEPVEDSSESDSPSVKLEKKKERK